MSEVALRDRIAGSLYGLLCGDALGCPVEMMSAAKLRAAYGRVDTMREPVGGRWRPAGLHSDDGQQAMCLCDAILEAPDDPAPGFVRQLVSLYADADGHEAPPYMAFGSHRGTGKNFREAVKRLALGAGTFEAAEPSAGNGNAMLIAPIAWFWRDDPDMLIRQAVRIGRVKQSDVRGIAAGVAVAWLVAACVRGELDRGVSGLECGVWVDAVRAGEDLAAQELGAREHVRTFSAGLVGLLERLDAPREQTLAWIGANAAATASRAVEATSGYALASVLCAIYMALVEERLEDAVVEAVMLGGDADTIGAIVGAIVGARHGVAAIPERWLSALIARGAFDDRLDPLCERAKPWLPEQPLHAQERAWTALQFRLPGSK